MVSQSKKSKLSKSLNLGSAEEKELLLKKDHSDEEAKDVEVKEEAKDIKKVKEPKKDEDKDWSAYYDAKKGALTEYQIKQISEILNNASKKKEKYEAASKSNRDHNKNIQTVIGVLLALTCGGSLISAFYTLNPEDPHFWGKLIETFLILVCAVAQVVSLKWNFALKSAMHHNTSTKFYTLILDTTADLVTGVDSRKDKCDEYIKNLNDVYGDICTEALPL